MEVLKYPHYPTYKVLIAQKGKKKISKRWKINWQEWKSYSKPKYQKTGHGGQVIPPWLNPAAEEMCEVHAKKS